MNFTHTISVGNKICSVFRLTHLGHRLPKYLGIPLKQSVESRRSCLNGQSTVNSTIIIKTESKPTVNDRKKWLPFKSLLMVGWISAACPTQAALVAHLKFDDNLNDQTGNHNGTVVGAVTGSIPAFDVGKIGKAVSIDGADVAVDLANPVTIDLGVDFTLALWFNSTSGAAENVLFYKGNPTSFGAGAKQFDHTGGGVAGGGPGLFIYNEGGGAIGAGWASNGMPIVHDGTWHHAALVHSVTTIPHITLYVDGIPKVRSSPESYFGGVTHSLIMVQNSRII